jgi:thiamine-phosphate pyrophosphorylase
MRKPAVIDRRWRSRAAGNERRVSGLYAITRETSSTSQLLEEVRAVLAGGARVVQYRNKNSDHVLKGAQIRALLELCREFCVPLLVNDSVDLAAETGVAGVHIGAQDGSVADARATLGPEKWIGVSCYDRLELAVAAQQAGADYVAFGSFFSSPTKPEAVRAPLELLGAAKRRIDLPVVAIGGIIAANVLRVMAAGADAVAVMSGLFEVEDPQAAARELSRLMSNGRAGAGG